MNKVEFTDALKYGDCQGSNEFLSLICRSDNYGKKPEPCPVDVLRGRNPEKLCNCCTTCRGNCEWTANILSDSNEQG